ncbi:MAG: hypothetical protein ACKPEY_16390 [Planctomycetota bacterium]
MISNFGQTTIVLLAVAWAASYVLWQALRTLQASWLRRATGATSATSGCGGGCHGCSRSAEPVRMNTFSGSPDPSAAIFGASGAESSPVRLVQLELAPLGSRRNRSPS